MKETGPNGPGANEESPNSFHREQPTPRPEAELVNLFAESGLFDTHTPAGRDPTVFPMDVMDHLRSDIGMKAYRISRYNRRLADQLESWKTSINKVTMAYEIIVYPTLEQAKQNLARIPVKDPDGPTPDMEEMRINEGIRDAQEHPYQNLDEYPHRGPIELTPLEINLLGRVTQTRGLPFNPEKRVYHYLELLPRLEAQSQTVRRSHWPFVENAIQAGILRPREEIEKEIADRQKTWTQRPTGRRSPGIKPPRTRK